MRFGALAISFFMLGSLAIASPPPMYLDESATQVIQPPGSNFIVILTDEGLLLTLTKAGEPRQETVWGSDRWHQVVPVELWRRQGIFVVRLAVSRDGNSIVLAEPNLEVESRDPTHVIATLIDTTSGHTKATIRLNDVVRNVAALKQKPFTSPMFHWGFVDSIATRDVLRIFTCEGRCFEYALSGALLGNTSMGQSEWKNTPKVPDFEMVCGAN